MRMFASLASRFSGGTHPRAVSLAVFLGLAAGFVQGWNLSLVALFVLIVLFDVRSRVALVCWGIGLGLSWLMAPVTFLLGRVVLDLTPLGSYLGQLGDGRAAALFGWDRYTLVGGILVGLAIAWPASSLLTRSVRRTRRLLHQARELRARLAPDVGPAVIAFPRSRISRKARFADWLRGRTTVDDEATRNRLFRRGGLSAATALIAVTAGVVFWQVPHLTSGRLYLAIQSANQARLEAAAFQLALWDGRLEIRDLRLADPNSLTHDRLRVAQLRADVDPAALLRGCLAIKRLDVSGVRTHVERPCPATPLAATCPLQCTPDAPSLELATVESTSPPEGVEARLAHWPEVRQALAQLGSMLGQIQRFQEEHAPRTLPLSLLAIGQTDITTLRSARSPLGLPIPTLAVASMRVEDLDPNWHLGNGATLHAEHLTSVPVAGPGAARLAIDAPDCGTRLLAEYAPHLGKPRWSMRLDAKNLAVARQISNSSSHQPLAIDGGQLSLSGLGWADANGFEMPLKIDGHDLACHSVEQQKLAGISAELWAAGIARLGEFKGEAICRGTWSEPRLEIDAAHLAEMFRHQLLMAGQHELLASVDSQSQSLDGQAPMPGLAQNETSHADAPQMAAVPTAPAAANDRYATPLAAAPTAAPQPAGTTPPQPVVSAVQQPVVPLLAETSPSTGQLASSPAASPAPAAVQTPATEVPANSVAAKNSAAATPASTELGNDLPVIEVGHPGPSIPAAVNEASPVVAAVGTPLQGPGPVDLTVGYDVSTELWQSPARQQAATVAQTPPPPRAPINVQPDREEPSGAELDQWVRQQEKFESQRANALAKQAPAPVPTGDEFETGIEDPAQEEPANRVGLLTRMKRSLGFGKEAATDPEAVQTSPDARLDEPARVARGRKEIRDDRGATKLR